MRLLFREPDANRPDTFDLAEIRVIRVGRPSIAPEKLRRGAQQVRRTCWRNPHRTHCGKQALPHNPGRFEGRADAIHKRVRRPQAHTTIELESTE
jgi:hypothetical protein